jgi:hypothetical protein
MRSILLILCIIVFINGATLNLIILENNAPVPARVLVMDNSGTTHRPSTEACYRIGSKCFFSCPGTANITGVPAGSIEIRAEKGHEYKDVRKFVNLTSAGLTDTIHMERWIDMNKRGYYCSESHVHLDWDRAAQLAAVEDLNWGISCNHWNDSWLSVPSSLTNEEVGTVTYGNVQGVSTLWDLEKEGEFGSNSLYSWGLPQKDTEPAGGGKPYTVYIKNIRAQGGLAGYWNGSGYRSDVLVSSLIGILDFVNIANNIFHRHFTKKFSYTEEELIEINYSYLERIWGAGGRVAVGAGTAIGVWEDAIGNNRVYTYTGESSANINSFKAAWRAGRNFMTNGPMIFLTLDNRYMPGDMVSYSPGDSLDISLRILANWPLRKAELVINGSHVPLSFPSNADSVTLSYKIGINVSTYITAYVACEDTILTVQEQQDYLNVDGQIARYRWAYSSPIYAIINNQAVHVNTDVQSVLSSINSYESWASGSVGSAYRTELMQDIQDAKNNLNNPPPVFPNVDNRINSFSPENARLVVMPNPFNSLANIFLKDPKDNSDGSNVSINIYNVKGRLVRHLQNPLTQGTYCYNWDGKDNRNRCVANGLYVLVLRINKGCFQKRIMFIR